MKWFHLVMIGLILLLASIAGSAQWGFDFYGNAEAITAEGFGSVSVTPDMTIMSVTVETSGDNTTIASAENRARVQSTLDALFDAGVKEGDIVGRSSGSSMSNFASMTIGNNTTNVSRESLSVNLVKETILFSVRTTDPSRIREIREAAIKGGANDASIAGYSISDTEAVEEAATEARRKALENARKNAEMMASAEGVQVGKVLKIYPTAGGADYTSGDIDSVDVTAGVIAIYEIIY